MGQIDRRRRRGGWAGAPGTIFCTGPLDFPPLIDGFVRRVAQIAIEFVAPGANPVEWAISSPGRAEFSRPEKERILNGIKLSGICLLQQAFT
jgi:hypothetical protein